MKQPKGEPVTPADDVPRPGALTFAGQRLMVAFDPEMGDWIRHQAKAAGLLPGEWVRSWVRRKMDQVPQREDPL